MASIVKISEIPEVQRIDEGRLEAIAMQLNSMGKEVLQPRTTNHKPPKPGNQLNDVLCRQYQDKFHFILPVFMNLTCQTITKVQLDICVAQISSVLTVTVYYGDLPEEFVQQLAENIQLRISNRCELYLKEDQFVENLVSNMHATRDEEERVLVFTIRAMLPVEIRCDVFWTPFETLYLRMTVKIAAQSMEFLDKYADVHFNILYCGELLEKMNGKLRDEDSKSYSELLRDFFSVESYVQHEKGREELDQVLDISHVQRYNEYGVSKSSRRFETFKTSSETQKKKKNIKGFWERFTKCLGCNSSKEQKKKQEQEEAHKKKLAQIEQRQQQNAKEAEQLGSILRSYGIDGEECFFLDGLKPRSDDGTKVPTWNIAVYEFKLFRYPLTTVIEILIPAVFLALINLAIYFQEITLSGRIASIATLLVAYTTFLPTVRQRIPPSPKLTLIEVLLYAIMLSSSLCLLRSFLDRSINKQEYKYNWREDPCFIISLTLLILVLVTVIVGLITRKLQVMIDAKNYEKFHEEGGLNVGPPRRQDWNNQGGEKYYANTNNLFKKYVPYSDEFVRTQSIFERLWLWRYKKGYLSIGPEDDPQCDWQIPLTTNIEEMHHREMWNFVRPYEKCFWEFYVYVNRVLYLHELSMKLSKIERGDNSSIAQFYRQRKLELERAITAGAGTLNTRVLGKQQLSMVSKYRLARTVLMLQYIRLEEHVEENIEFCFEDNQQEEEINIPNQNVFIPQSTFSTERMLFPINTKFREP